MTPWRSCTRLSNGCWCVVVVVDLRAGEWVVGMVECRCRRWFQSWSIEVEGVGVFASLGRNLFGSHVAPA